MRCFQHKSNPSVDIEMYSMTLKEIQNNYNYDITVQITSNLTFTRTCSQNPRECASSTREHAYTGRERKYTLACMYARVASGARMRTLQAEVLYTYVRTLHVCARLLTLCARTRTVLALAHARIRTILTSAAG